MWPVSLNMTRDDCRRTLRRLELEAYANMINVFRAQGALEDGRRKLLEELREALHIGGDRHSAEARRAANDELLATIAEQMSGPNTGLGWISEGRRRVPLMPRGIPQTAYTELADKVALQAAAENEELKKRLEAERLVAPRSAEDLEMQDAEGETAEGALHSDINLNDEMLYPPIVMEDQSIKILEMEVFSRKRKPETSALPDDVATTPAKNVKNTSRVSNQKHLNLSQIYSNYSKTPTGKSSGQSKHSYNQVSKVSNKANQPHTPRSTNKRRKQNPSERTKSSSKAQAKIPHDLDSPLSSKQYSLNPISMQMDFNQPPPTFQASYAQSILSVGLKNYGDDSKNQQNLLSDSPTMRLLAQPATTPHELGVHQPDDPSALQAQSTPIKHSPTAAGKPCHFIIKKKGNLTLDKPHSPQKVQMSEIKILKKPEGIKVLPKKQVIVGPNSTQKSLNAAGKGLNALKLTKIVHNIPSKPPAGLNSSSMEKVVVMPGSQKPMQKSIPNPKNIIITSNVTTPITKGTVSVDSNNISPKTADDGTPKGIAANDVKVSTKTFLLNPKSGQKMVVLPAKARGKTNIEGQTMPLLHFKGMPTTMKLVPVNSSISQMAKSNSNVTIVSRPSMTNAVTTTNTKIIGIEGVKTSIAQGASSRPHVQGLQIAPKLMGTPIVRQSTTKGSVIVVQKGTPLGKTLSFTKNSSEMSKIVMGKNVNKLMQAQSHEPTKDSAKKTGNVIVLDLNDQLGPTTTMSKILDSHTAKSGQAEEPAKVEIVQAITEDTPVLFDTQISEETCNANSMDSLITVDMGQLEEGTISSIEKEDEHKSGNEHKENESAKDTSSVTDWEMELDTVGHKRKADDSGSLHLELCMSSDSETDAYLVKTEKPKSQPAEGHHGAATEESSGLFGERGGLSRASRTLLSQLQDEGSSSNDSHFALNKAKLGLDKALEKSGTSATDKDASAKETDKGDSGKSQAKRMDMFGTSDIQLGPFGYLESDEGMMSGEDMFSVGGEVEESGKGSGAGAGRAGPPPAASLDLQLSRLLGEPVSDTNSVSEMPLSK